MHKRRRSVWRVLCALAVALCLFAVSIGHSAPPKFEKVSDHCYVLQGADNGTNILVIVTDDGVVLVNGPSEQNLSVTIEALKVLTTKPVRWIVPTDFRHSAESEIGSFVESGAVLIESEAMAQLSKSIPNPEGRAYREPQLVFGRQLHLFPGGIEVRLIAVDRPATTGADLVVFVPGEKVIAVGDAYTQAFYPEVDTASGGEIIGWIEGMKGTIDSIPVLKPAASQIRPQQKTDKPVEEKTLEELFPVIPSHGVRSNLQELKDLLDATQKFRALAARAVKTGATYEELIASPAAGPFTSYNNFELFSQQLFEAMAPVSDKVDENQTR